MGSLRKILLVNPWIADFAAYDLWSKPLGLLILAGYLELNGFQIQLLDLMDCNHPAVKPLLKKSWRKGDGRGKYFKTIIPRPEALSFVPRNYGIYGMPPQVLEKELKKLQKPDLILITTMMTYWYPGVVRTLQYLREEFPGAIYVAGGNYVTLMPDHSRQNLPVDFILPGYGEESIGRLLESLDPRLNLRFKQLTYQGQYELPWWLYHELDSVVLLTSRGCPFSCSFCATRLLNKTFRQFPVEDVLSELKWISYHQGVKEVAFYDDALFVNRDRHIIPLLEGIIEEGLSFHFHTPNGLFPEMINEHLAELLFQVGFKTIRLSLETVSMEFQERISKKVSQKGFERGVKALLDAGFEPWQLEVYLIMGLPGQKPEDVYESIDFVRHLGLISRLASFSPIPGTLEYRRAIEMGYISEEIDPLLLNNTVFPAISGILSFEQIQELRNYANLANQEVKSHGYLETTD